ncbi:hypothetical protein T05_7868 [Trichinella murrelli]|uniref:Uncharacterized protein n=1 Tax=Trichinella murrelli TaxID=144512 RepID=A0A0V0SSB2_9BILA|nr:hypothetical protein T05_7868 [Trichinella murrelli]
MHRILRLDGAGRNSRGRILTNFSAVSVKCAAFHGLSRLREIPGLTRPLGITDPGVNGMAVLCV